MDAVRLAAPVGVPAGATTRRAFVQAMTGGVFAAPLVVTGATGTGAAPRTLGATAIEKGAATMTASAQVASPTPEELTVHRRAVEAVIWGMPLVNYDVMRQAFFRHAAYGDVIYWSWPADWKLQCLTPNTTSRYVFSFVNTREAGPVVVEVPAAGETSIKGTLIDGWQIPLADVGSAGPDQGQGGRYVFLPPAYAGDVPEGAFALPMQSYNGFVGLRLITQSNDAAAMQDALAYLQQIRIYPLSDAESPPASQFVDMVDTVWDTLPRYDDTFYTSLARMVGEEPAHPRDAVMTEMLRSLGIEPGQDFAPDEPTRAILTAAAQEAHAWFMDGLVTYGEPYWPHRGWETVVPAIGPQSGFTWEADGVYDTDARGIGFSSFFCLPKKLGTGQSYLVTFSDGAGQRLDGGQTYRLRVPGDVPVAQFWSVTVYDHATCALYRNAVRPSLDSYNTDAVRGADGGMDVYFGPEAPDGQEANWIPTEAGGGWFPYFRLFGPQPPYVDKTWVLPDIEPVP